MCFSAGTSTTASTWWCPPSRSPWPALDWTTWISTWFTGPWAIRCAYLSLICVLYLYYTRNPHPIILVIILSDWFVYLSQLFIVICSLLSTVHICASSNHIFFLLRYCCVDNISHGVLLYPFEFVLALVSEILVKHHSYIGQMKLDIQGSYVMLICKYIVS